MGLLELLFQEIKNKTDLIPIYGFIKAYNRSEEELNEIYDDFKKEDINRHDFLKI